MAMRGTNENDEDRLEGAETERLHETLLRAILWRDLTPGMKLSEEVIARSLGVTRTVVRAALNRLCAQGLVVFQKNRGAFAATASDRDADEIFDLRIILGRETAARLATRISAAELARLEANVADHRARFRAGDDRAAVQLAEEFHLLMVNMAGNEALAELMKILICRSALVLAAHSRSKTSELGIDEHVQIIDALRRGDPAEAAAVMGRHLENVLKRTRLADDVDGKRGLSDILARHLGREPAATAPVRAVKRRPRQKQT